jgi:hypothetical protein
MKCSVCGTESKGDARFCAGCGATLIVAKADETMLDLRTALFRRPVIIPAAPPGIVPPPPAPPKESLPGAAPGAAPARSSAAGILLVICAVGVIGYFVYQVAMTYGPGLAKPGASPVEAPASPPASAMPAPAPLKPQMSPPAQVAAPAPALTQMPAPAPVPVAAEPKPAPAPEPPKPAASRSPDAPVRAAAPKSAPEAPETPVRAAAGAPAAVPAAEPRPPRRDRWQDMKDAFARCRRENLISRTVCEQRVLFLYCDGYWGKVPQCPEAQNPDPRK